MWRIFLAAVWVFGIVQLNAAATVTSCYECGYIPSNIDQELQGYVDMWKVNNTDGTNGTELPFPVDSKCNDAKSTDASIINSNCTSGKCELVSLMRGVTTIAKIRQCVPVAGSCDTVAATSRVMGNYTLRTTCCKDKDNCNGDGSGGTDETGAATSVSMSLAAWVLTLLLALCYIN